MSNQKIEPLTGQPPRDAEQDMIRALLDEREGVDRIGKKDRVKAIDAELNRLGYKPDKSSAARSRAAAAKKTPAKKTAEPAARRSAVKSTGTPTKPSEKTSG